MRSRVENIARNRRRTVCSSEESGSFQGEFATAKTQIDAKRSIWMFENVLYAIRYPLATELFANKKVASATRSNVNPHDVFDGPLTIDFGVAKTFPITIMRLPRWKR